MNSPDAASVVNKADVRAQPFLAFLPQFGKPRRCPYCGHELFEDDDLDGPEPSP
jgi:hypothetical protein